MVAFQALVFAVIFWRLRQRLHTTWLSVFLGLYSLPALAWFIRATPILAAYPRMPYWPIGFYFAALPGFYLYARSLVKPIVWKEVRPHLVVPALEFGQMTVLTLLPDPTFASFSKSGDLSVWALSFAVVLALYNVGYSLAVIRLVRRHNHWVRGFFSTPDPHLLTWLAQVALLQVLLYSLELFISLFVVLRVYYDFFVVFGAALHLAFVYWFSLASYRYANNGPDWVLVQPEANQAVDDKQSMEQPGDWGDKIQTLEQVMGAGLYRDPDLNLARLADACNMTQRLLSRMIQEVHGKNFSAYINSFRVEKAKEMMMDTKNKHISMEGFGQMAGFASRSTFFNQFKSITGLSPGAYQAQNRP